MNQRGNTVILALGCVAVIAGISIEVWRVRSESTRQMKKQAALKDEAESVMETLSAHLQNPEDCTNALAGEHIEAGKRSDISLHFPLELENVKLSSLQLEVQNDQDFQTEILDTNGIPTELRRYPATLHADFQDNSGEPVAISRAIRMGLDGTKALDLGIPIFVWTLPPPPIGTGQIQSCFGHNSAGALCNEMGGYFIPGMNPRSQSCRQSMKTLKRVGSTLAPLSNCRMGGVVDKPSQCPQFGVPFGASQMNSRADIATTPGTKYVCQLCQ